MIDLRSDTVTLPSPEMRRAMYEAELGDDVFGDDPTVRALEQRAAALLGKQAAVFVPSGTQANLVAILAHCARGDEAVMGAESHIFHYELAGCAAVAGVQAHLVANLPDGTLDLAALAAAIRVAGPLAPPTTLVCLENTQNRCSGSPLDAAQTAAIAQVAHERGVPLHLDGARLFNAATALDATVGELAGPADSAWFALSKGLGAPAGSVLCGTTDFIGRARRWRKTLGGSMRQSGVLAAAGLYALDHMVERLQDDHHNARYLADGLAELPGISIQPDLVRTNIVVADIAGSGLTTADLLPRLAAEGLLAVSFGPTLLRLVTHYGISHADCAAGLDILRRVLRQAAPPASRLTPLSR